MIQTCLVNLFHLDPASNGGASRAAKEVCQMMVDYDRAGQLRLIFAVGWRFAAQFAGWIHYPQAQVIPCFPEQELTPIFMSIQPDVVVSPLYGLHPFDPRHNYPDAPYIVVMPESLFLEGRRYLPPEQIQHQQALYAQLPHVNKVVVFSEHTRRQFIEKAGLLPAQVKTAHLAGDLLTRPGEAQLPETNISQPYLFYPANGWPHKRHDFLLQIMSVVWQTRPELKLVLAGWHAPGFIDNLVQQHHCPPDQIVNLGYISNDMYLASLYQQAEALLFTSAYESFGMPLLEAMVNGCPVICRPVSAMPEVAADAALYVDSTNPADWAAAVLDFLPAQRAGLIKKGIVQAGCFSWQKYREVWRQLLIEVGLQLSFDQQSIATARTPGPLHLSLPEVSRELGVWAGQYAAQNSELEAKEAQIQAQAVELQAKEVQIQSQAGQLQAKEAQIQAQAVELQAKEAQIQAYIT